MTVKHIVLALGLLAAVPALQAAPADLSPLAERIGFIDRQLARGEIEPVTALKLKYQALTRLDGSALAPRTPQRLAVNPRGMTMLLLQARQEWLRNPGHPDLDFYRTLMKLPASVSRQQERFRNARGGAVSQAVNESESEHFIFYYGDSIRTNGLVDSYKAALERSWEVQVDDLDWTAPATAGNGKFPVYVANSGLVVEGETVTLEPGTFAYVASGEDGLSFMVINDEYESWILPNDDPEGDVAGAIRATAAHEFHHAIQFGIDQSDSAWFYEATSVWMEDRVFDNVNDFYNYLRNDDGGNGWMFYPEASLVFFNGEHEYGSGIFSFYLSENYQCDQSLRKIWDEMGRVAGDNTLEAIEKHTESVNGMSLEQAFRDFAQRNLLLDYAEGSAWAEPALAAEVDFYPSEVNPTLGRPDYLGTNYIAFTNGDGSNLRLSFEGGDMGGAVAWGANVLIASGGSIERRAIELDSTGEGQIVVGPFDSDTQMALVVTVLSDLGITPGDGEGVPLDSYPNGAPYRVVAELTGDPVTGMSGGEEDLIVEASAQCGGSSDDDDDDDSSPSDDDDDADDDDDGGSEDSGGCAQSPLNAPTAGLVLTFGMFLAFARGRSKKAKAGIAKR